MTHQPPTNPKPSIDQFAIAGTFAHIRRLAELAANLAHVVEGCAEIEDINGDGGAKLISALECALEAPLTHLRALRRDVWPDDVSGTCPLCYDPDPHPYNGGNSRIPACGPAPDPHAPKYAPPTPAEVERRRREWQESLARIRAELKREDERRARARADYLASRGER